MKTKQDYLNDLAGNRGWRESVATDPNRLVYHLMAPDGWLNDPNGLCQFKGINHIYYQYTPFSAAWGVKYWGHYTTADWIHYREEEPFLFPDQEMDRDGVYSGSAIVENGRIYYFYTGNVKYLDREYDYILEGREQNTICVVSEDGLTHSEKTCMLANEDYPANMTKHVRDPKIFKRGTDYYMVLGARDDEGRGCVLMYRSRNNLVDWKYFQTVYPKGEFGYMWECPDLYELDGQLILTVCPQGLEPQGYDYANIYQAGYFPLQMDFETGDYSLGEFRELDRGFDFYAPQSFEDESGRRILIAWMGMPDADYDNGVTVERGWQHALTMPRELHYRNGRIFQTPLKEFEGLRKGREELRLSEASCLEWEEHAYELEVVPDREGSIRISLLDDVLITYEDHVFTLALGKSGRGRDLRSVYLDGLQRFTVFVDQSCIEIFINGGEEVFTSRVYDETRRNIIRCKAEGTDGRVTIYPLAAFSVSQRT